MTIRQKKFLIDTTLIGLFATIFVFAFVLVGRIGVAQAATVAPDPNDPQGLAESLYAYIRDGAHLPAVGVALMLFVYGLRWGATKIPVVGPWFAGTLGGWVLGFGTASVLFVGTTLAAGQSITIGILMQALGTGFAATGKWEGLRDLFGYFRGGAQPTMGIVKKASGAAVVLAVIIISACTGCPGPTPVPVQDVVDCTKLDQEQLLALAGTCSAKVPDWGAVEECVVKGAGSAAWQIGGCVLSDLVQQYLVKKSAPLDPAQTKSAHDALEDYRSKYGHGATYKTAAGAL